MQHMSRTFLTGRGWRIESLSQNGRIYPGDSAIFRAAFKFTSDYDIHSVRRVADNELFTIGDVIRFNIGDVQNAPIEKFELDRSKHGIIAWHLNCGVGLDSWLKVFPENKAPQPPDCSRHKKEVAGISDMKLLAGMVGDLHYKSLEDFIGYLCTKLYKDGLKDRMNNREKLGYVLTDASDALKKAAKHIAEAWVICQPYMKSDNNTAT
jgi:hypothetical protein